MSSGLELFTADRLPQLSWPASEDAHYARRYLLAFMQAGPQHFISNVQQTQVLIARLAETIVPLTITDFHPENSYVCSPYGHYIRYGGYEETRHVMRPLLAATLRAAIRPLDLWLRYSAFDRVVMVNNWLLSTNLYPQLSAEAIGDLARALPELFADRAIVFRSVDAYQNPLLFHQLRQAGYRMILSRQVYYQEPEIALGKKQVRIDRKVLRSHPYTLSDDLYGSNDIARITELYSQLYLDKYSRMNPQFSEVFVHHLWQNHLCYFRVFRFEGRIDGVLAYYIRNGVMTPPIFGYDTSLPKEVGLYRLLSLQTLLEAQAHGIRMHASAGVGQFKRLRGGVAVSEYNAVFDRHLPAYRRAPWAFLEQVSERIARPLFRHYGF